MAVTQISRIQVRRGRKQSGPGVPQLASGEIAWAVDSQELFIGNGSVAEGAPYVGNTKVLTEHDNILALISAYRFAADDPTIPFSVARSFQGKLDEYVSVADFGAIGDGVSDSTEAFETAMFQLYYNSNEKYKKVLTIPNGDYVFFGDLRVPSFAILRGETPHGVTLRINGGTLKFVTENANDPSEFTLSDRPEYINIADLTIDTSLEGIINLSGVENITFDNVQFRSSYSLEDPIEDPFEQDTIPSLYWNNDNLLLPATKIKFKECKFINSAMAIKVDQSVNIETSVVFYKCLFDNLDVGVYINGIEDQPNKWRFDQCEFSNIANYLLFSRYGTDTLIRESSFENVGNNTTGEAVNPMVLFGQSNNNLVIDCISDRQPSTGITALESRYVPEVYGADKVNFLTRTHLRVTTGPTYRDIAVFSAFNKVLELDYVLKFEEFDTRENAIVVRDVRSGKLKITTNVQGQVDDNPIDIADNYTYTAAPGEFIGYVEGTTLFVTEPIIVGQLYIGATISGPGIIPGTRIVNFSGNVDLNTFVGDYTISNDHPSPSSTGIKNFVRDVVTRFEFAGRVDNYGDSSIPWDAKGEQVDTVTLNYINPDNRGLSGTLSFDVSYGV
jgi:hypothetical protein